MMCTDKLPQYIRKCGPLSVGTTYWCIVTGMTNAKNNIQVSFAGQRKAIFSICPTREELYVIVIEGILIIEITNLMQ